MAPAQFPGQIQPEIIIVPGKIRPEIQRAPLAVELVGRGDGDQVVFRQPAIFRLLVKVLHVANVAAFRKREFTAQLVKEALPQR